MNWMGIIEKVKSSLSIKDNLNKFQAEASINERKMTVKAKLSRITI